MSKMKKTKDPTKEIKDPMKLEIGKNYYIQKASEDSGCLLYTSPSPRD